MSKALHWDVESRSAADLKKVGAHRYAEDPSTDILLFSYRFGSGPIQRWIKGQPLPPEVVAHVEAGGPMVGHNQQFERVMAKAVFGWNIRPEQQDCTISRAAAMGLPHSLDNLGKALDLTIQKDKVGHSLMLKMCKPKTREPELTWHEDPADVQRLADYCDVDVATECGADAALPPLSERERRVWILDQHINDRGFAVDTLLAARANACVEEAKRRADREMWRLTNGAVDKASKVQKLIGWLSSRGIPCESVADGEIDELIVGADLLDDQAAADALALRRNSAGAFKFEAMLRAVCADGRVRGCLQYHGTHGGRWAGRVVQPQNFKRIDTEEQQAQVEMAFGILRRYDDPAKALDAMELLLDMPALEVLTLCARGMIVAAPGHELFDADFSNIEGRLNAWFAGEDWKIDAFHAYDRGEGPDLYKVTASKVTGVPVEQISKSQRQNEGKVPELACGYQGGLVAFQKMGAKFGLSLPTSKVKQIVSDWRASNSRIAASWGELGDAAIEAVKHPGMIVPCLGGKVKYLRPTDQDFLWCLLPSGRVISYAKPRVGWRKKIVTIDDEQVELENFGLTYWGQKSGRWLQLDLYGGAQCAHVVSGTARDLLVEAAFAVEAASYPLILTVHDELLCERPVGQGSVEEFEYLIAKSKSRWVDGLPLVSKAWKDVRYAK